MFIFNYFVENHMEAITAPYLSTDTITDFLFCEALSDLPFICLQLDFLHRSLCL